MTTDQFDTISRKLDVLIRLSALSLVAAKPKQDQVTMLSSAGFRPKEIADMCGTTANAVRVALSMMRKKRKARQRVARARGSVGKDIAQTGGDPRVAPVLGSPPKAN